MYVLHAHFYLICLFLNKWITDKHTETIQTHSSSYLDMILALFLSGLVQQMLVIRL